MRNRRGDIHFMMDTTIWHKDYDAIESMLWSLGVRICKDVDRLLSYHYG